MPRRYLEACNLGLPLQSICCNLTHEFSKYLLVAYYVLSAIPCFGDFKISLLLRVLPQIHLRKLWKGSSVYCRVNQRIHSPTQIPLMTLDPGLINRENESLL